MISVGTFIEYGEAGLKYEFIPIDCDLSPAGAYAASKTAFSVAMQALCKEYNVYSTYFRLFSVFGEGQNENNFFPSLKKAALSGEDFQMTKGEQIRDFISISTVVSQITEGLEFNEASLGVTNILNIGSGNPQSILDFAQLNWTKWGAKGRINAGSLPYRENEIMRYVAKI